MVDTGLMANLFSHESKFMRLYKSICLLIFTLLISSCGQQHHKHDKYVQNEQMAATSTPLEEILQSSTIYGDSDFNDAKANFIFNNRSCDVLDNLSDLDKFHTSWTAQKCKIGYENEHYIKISSFVSPLGKMPYVEIGRKKTEMNERKAAPSIAIFLVGSTSQPIWRSTEGSYASFFKESLSEYDTIYIPAYYGTSGRSKAVGPILEAAAEELDLFLDFISYKNSVKSDVLSASGGGPLSTLLKSSNVQRNILINPPLASFKRIYRQRNEPIFHGPPRDRNLKSGNRVGLGDIITLEKGNSRFYMENNADFVVRYFGDLFDKALVEYIDSDDYKFQDCSHILIGKNDKTIGRKFVDLDKMSTPFDMLDGVNHDFIDTLPERETVVKAVRAIRLKEELCNN